MVFRLKRPEPTEAQAMAAIRTALHYHPAVARVHRMNSGAHVINAPTGRRFVRYHDVEGLSDLWVWLKPAYGPRQAFIEVKRPSEMKATTDKQKLFIEAAKLHGHIAFVACSAEQALRELEAAL